MAEHLTQSHLETMIAASRQALTREGHEKFDGKTCVECANDMPLERLQMGRVRCTDCQSAQEKMQKRYRN